MKPRIGKQRDDGELVCPSDDPEIKKFFAAHGKFIYVGPNGREVVFRDGSTISYAAAACGWETPVDADELTKLERAQNKVRYWQKVAEDATKAFRDLKKYYEVDLPSHMEIDDDDTAKLIVLRDKARHARAKLRKAQQAVKDEQPFHLRKREQLRLQQQKEHAQARRRVSAIQE